MMRAQSSVLSGIRHASTRVAGMAFVAVSLLMFATCGSASRDEDKDPTIDSPAEGGRRSANGGEDGEPAADAAAAGTGGAGVGGRAGTVGGTAGMGGSTGGRIGSGGAAGGGGSSGAGAAGQIGMGGTGPIGTKNCPAPTPLPPVVSIPATGTQYEAEGTVMWLPSGATTIRGLVGFASFASGASGYDDIKMRAMAARNNLGLLRWNPGCWWCTRRNYDDLETNADRLIGTVLPSLATKSGHPEVAFTGIFATGLSAGSWDASALAIYHPRRIIGAFPVAGGWDGWVWQRLVGESMKVPFVGINQGEDGFYPGSSVGTEEDIVRGRAQLAPWSHMIALGCGHDSWCKMDWIYVWIEEVTRHRVPANIPSGALPTYADMTEGCGWLGRLVATNRATSGSRWEVTSADVWAASAAPGDAKTLQWFPSQRAAESWKRYMTNNGMLP